MIEGDEANKGELFLVAKKSETIHKTHYIKGALPYYSHPLHKASKSVLPT